jgi:hypothetical protein
LVNIPILRHVNLKVVKVFMKLGQTKVILLLALLSQLASCGDDPAATSSSAATAPTNQNSVFSAANSSVPGGEVSIASTDNASFVAWLAPSGTTSFTAGDTMTKADSGTATSIIAPTTKGTYNLYVLNSSGESSEASTSTLRVLEWDHEAYLKSKNNSDQDYFGGSVAIDGDTIAVGTAFEDSNTNTIIQASSGTLNLSSTNNTGTGSGAIYVYVRSGSNWSEEAYLKASESTANDFTGGAIAISGDTIVAGAKAEDSNTTAIINTDGQADTNDGADSSGAVFILKRSGVTWTQDAYLKAPNAGVDDLFGASVAIDGDTIVVGAFGENSTTVEIVNGTSVSSSNNSGTRDGDDGNGAVYVFKKDGGGDWALEAYLKAPNNSDADRFGHSVAIDDDTIVVSSVFEGSSTTTIINGSDLSAANNSGDDNGAAYVFKRSGTTWSHEAYLKAPNSSNGDNFGNSVAIDGDTIVVGASNEDSSTTSIINSSDLSSTNNSGSNNGAAYVFKRSGTTWSHEAYLKPPITSNSDRFGFRLAIDGDVIAVAAINESSTTQSIIVGTDLSSSNVSGSNNGAVYIFKRTGSLWAYEAYLKAPNNGDDDTFGNAVSISSGTVVIAATGEDSDLLSLINGEDLTTATNDGNDNGAVYVFRISE